MKERIYLYPIWVRLWHLYNAFLILLLILTGLYLHYSWTDYLLIPFNVVILVHNISGLALFAGYMFYLIGNHFTSNGIYYHSPMPGRFSRVFKQFRYYAFGIFKNEDPPFPVSIDRKFNPLQKFSYLLIMYFFVPVIIVTGVGLLFPEILPLKIFNVSGILLTDMIHITSGFLLTVFLVIHIYFCTIGKVPLACFKCMINGWHE